MPSKHDVIDSVNHITRLWHDGSGHYTRRESSYSKAFTKISDFKGGNVLEIGPGTGQFGLWICSQFKVDTYNILDLESNIGDSVTLFDKNSIKFRKFESYRYKELYNTKFDLFIANMCLSEIPDYYREDIANNIFINCSNIFICDGDDENNVFNDWMMSSIDKHFTNIKIRDIGYYKCMAISGQLR